MTPYEQARFDKCDVNLMKLVASKFKTTIQKKDIEEQ